MILILANRKGDCKPGAKTVGYSAFYNCTALTGLEPGEGITSLVFGESFRKFITYYNSPYSPINYMTGLKTITFHGTTVPTYYSNGYDPFWNAPSWRPRLC